MLFLRTFDKFLLNVFIILMVFYRILLEKVGLFKIHYSFDFADNANFVKNREIRFAFTSPKQKYPKQFLHQQKDNL